MPQVSQRAARSLLIALSALAVSCNLSNLVVESLTVPEAVRPGDEFVSESRVCNEGLEISQADTLEFYVRSTLDPANEILIGAHPVPPLEPEACNTQETLLTAPSGLPDGAVQLIGRMLEGGREAASSVFGLGYLPDLVVEEVSGPPSATPSSSFDVTARVCNQGTEWAATTTLTLYLSEDWVLDGPQGAFPDYPAGSFVTPDLPPGACASVEGTASAAAPTDGAYLLAAIVNETDLVDELRSDNNQGGTLIGVGYMPDLALRSVSGPGSTLNGSSFEVEATVCNDGTVPSPDTHVSFLFSEDQLLQLPSPPDPAAGDFWLGTLPVPSLPPGACHTAMDSIPGSVPFDGAWYLGAAVDETQTVDELFEYNNQKLGPLMGVGNGPDLVVEAITGPPSTEHWASFGVQVELCNRGTAPASSSEVRLYLSADATLAAMPEGSDPDVGAAFVDPLAPGACSNVLVEAFADSSISGSAMLFARTDASDQIPELIETNNLKAGPSIGVGSGPDLVLRSISAAASVESGSSFSVELDLCNEGTMPSSPSSVALYHSTDATIEAGPGPGLDFYVGEIVFVDTLIPGACTSLSGTAMAPTADGAYYLGAVADELELVEELREENNQLIGPLMGVGYGPDLVVASLDAPPSALPDSFLPLDFEVCNQGTGPSGPTLVAFYDSADAVIETGPPPPPPSPDSDRWLGDEMVPDLQPGSCYAGAKEVWLPSGDLGERRLAAMADDPDSVQELVEANNLFVGPTLGVGSGPDLVVTSLVPPPSAQLFGTLSVDTQVCNQGTDPSGPVSLWLYLSSDQDIDGSYFDPASGDPWLADVSVPGLAPGACHDEVAFGPPSVPNEGAWYVGGIVDEGMHLDELIESNNATVGPLVGLGDGPDLVVLSLEVPPSAEPGASFPVSAELCNQGTAYSPHAYVTLYLSEDDEIDSIFPGPPGADMPFASLSVDPLMQGECRSVAGMGSAAVPTEGPWFVAAVVDDEAAVPELIETNNSLLGPVMGIGYAPDLVITTLSAPAGLMVGASFPADVEVCNQGTVWSPPSMLTLYHSDDDSFDWMPPFPDTWLGDLALPDLAPGACHAETKIVDTGVPGPGFLGASVDEGDGITELIETNNMQLLELEVTP